MPGVAVPNAPNTQIQDAQNDGHPRFYWLPPIAPATTYDGTFDGTLSPVIRICRLPNSGCSTPLVQLTRTSSPAITVSTTAQSYSVSWSTKASNITVGDYRAEVWIGWRKLGFADVRVVNAAKDLKTVPEDFVGVQKGKALTFAFRLETGIVESITIAPSNPSIDSAATLQLTATVRDFNGNVVPGAQVTWTSVNTAIATVTPTGLVKGMALGTTSIVASSDSVFANNTVTIVRRVVGEVVVNPSGMSVAVGDTTRLWATVFDTRGEILPDRQITWSSANTAIATVSSTGLVTGVAAGTVAINATADGVSGSTDVQVTQAPVARVDVSPPETQLTVHGTTTLTATTFDANNNVLSGRAVAWESSDTSVFVIGPNGNVIATGPGYQRAIATSEGMQDSAFVEVTGATVNCVHPLALPRLWFIAGIVGRRTTGHLGVQFGGEPPTTLAGEYYAVQYGLDGGADIYRSNLLDCSTASATLGAPNRAAVGNLTGPTVVAMDSLFARDPGAHWDESANGGQGGIVGSNAAPGTQSARVLLVGLFEPSDHTFGSSVIRFRQMAYVFVESYVRTTDESGARAGDLTFRFVGFAP